MSNDLAVTEIYHDGILTRQIRPLNALTAEEFLINYANSGTKAYAAQAAKVPLSLINTALKKDPLFSAAFEEAKELWLNKLEKECQRRALDGVDTPVINRQTGQVLGHIRKYSDRCLELLLRKADPYGYGNRVQIEANLNAGVLHMPSPTSPKDAGGDNSSHFPIEDDNTIETTATPVKMEDKDA